MRPLAAKVPVAGFELCAPVHRPVAGNLPIWPVVGNQCIWPVAGNHCIWPVAGNLSGQSFGINLSDRSLGITVSGRSFGNQYIWPVVWESIYLAGRLGINLSGRSLGINLSDQTIWPVAGNQAIWPVVGNKSKTTKSTNLISATSSDTDNTLCHKYIARTVVPPYLYLHIFNFTHPPVLSALLLILSSQPSDSSYQTLHCWFPRLFLFSVHLHGI